MRKQIFAAATALCLMATTTLFAQESNPQTSPKTPPTAEQMAQRQTERMTRQLQLTDAQAKQVYEVNLNQIKQTQAMRAKMNEARKAEADKMKSILSTEQFMQWSQMQGPRPGQPGNGPQAKHRKGMKQGDCPNDCKGDCPRKDRPGKKK